MVQSSTATKLDDAGLTLGLGGFTFEDLYRPEGLRRLTERFHADLGGADPELGLAFERFRSAGGKGLSAPEESELLIRVSRHLAAFIGRLFGIGRDREALAGQLTRELPLFDFKREFIARRVYKEGAPDRPSADEYPALHQKMARLLSICTSTGGETD